MLKISKKKLIMFSLFAFCFVLFLSNDALAVQSTQDFEANDMIVILCNVMGLVTGGIGRTFAAFAIISLGIGFFGGKISWGTMIGVTLGIAAMFGAPTIVNAITGGDFSCEEINQ